jgi:hypothetical protein
VRLRTALIAATAAGLSAALAGGTAVGAATAPSGPSISWTASRASAPQPPVASSTTFGPNWSTDGFSDQTVRQTLRLSSGGGQVRIRLSNQYGTQPLPVSDVLAGRLAAARIPLGVANAGITGNLLLSQVPCFGEAGLARFQRDALGQPGVRTVILLEGTNDIWDSRDIPACGITPPSPPGSSSADTRL